MAKSASAPSLIPAFLALFIIILFAYLIYSDLESSRTEHILPPIEIIDLPDDLPLTVIEQQSESTDNEDALQQEAELFVEQLSPAGESAIAITEGNDQFVRHDNMLSLPKIEQRQTTIAELLADPSLSGEMPITLDFDTEKRTITTLAQLQNDLEDHTATITIITADGKTLSQPLADIINQYPLIQHDEITLVEIEHHHIDTTVAELDKLEIDPQQAVLASITLGVRDFALSDLISENENSATGLYYVHRVTDQDEQGLWGIIQAGLIDKFRQGLRIEGISPNKELAQAVIPADADEKLASGMSSFLGKILDNKVDHSYIYNFHTKTMGRNANLIHPGQQVILIEFSAAELAEIYQFFSDKRNQGTETFPIND